MVIEPMLSHALECGKGWIASDQTRSTAASECGTQVLVDSHSAEPNSRARPPRCRSRATLLFVEGSFAVAIRDAFLGELDALR
jgi:hypothetical protein